MPRTKAGSPAVVLVLFIALMPVTARADWPAQFDYIGDDEGEDSTVAVAVDGAGYTYVLATCDNSDDKDVVVVVFDLDGDVAAQYVYDDEEEDDEAIGFVVTGPDANSAVVVYAAVRTGDNYRVVRWSGTGSQPDWTADFEGPGSHPGSGWRLAEIAAHWRPDIEDWGVVACGVGFYDAARDTDLLTVCYEPDDGDVSWAAWYDGYNGTPPQDVTSTDRAAAVACNVEGVPGVSDGGDVFVAGAVNVQDDEEDPVDYAFCVVKYAYNGSLQWVECENLLRAREDDDEEELPVDMVVDHGEQYSLYVIGQYLAPEEDDDPEHYETGLLWMLQNDWNRDVSSGAIGVDGFHYTPIQLALGANSSEFAAIRRVDLENDVTACMTARLYLRGSTLKVTWESFWDVGDEESPGPAGIAAGAAGSIYVTANSEATPGDVTTLAYDPTSGLLAGDWSESNLFAAGVAVVASGDGPAMVGAIVETEDGADVLVMRYGDAATWGWVERALEPERFPAGSPTKYPSHGAWLAYYPGNQYVYAAKGNKKLAFYRYDPDTANHDPWTPLASILAQPSGKMPYKGSSGCAGPDSVWMVKGNKTSDFYVYNATGNTWAQRPDVPLGPSNKPVRDVSDLAYVVRSETGWVYLLKGYRNEFYRYNTRVGRWDEMEPIPSENPRWKPGSWLVYDGADRIYAHQGKYHGFFEYNLVDSSWSTASLPGMPFDNSRGRTKKSSDGGAAVCVDGSIFALKGNNSQEFWLCVLSEAGTAWGEMDTVPMNGSHRRKAVRGGGSIVYASGCFHAIKGNKLWEVWTYRPVEGDATLDALVRQTKLTQHGWASARGRSTAPRDNEVPWADGLAAEAPRWNKKGTDVCYFRDDDYGYGQVFMLGTSTGGNEVQLTTGPTDHEYPVFSPEGDLIACQYFDTLTDCYQLAKVSTKKPYAFTPLTAAEYDHEYPEWSPDGTRLVCQRDDSTGYYHIVLYTLSTSAETRLTGDDADHETPAFLSDTLVVYSLSPDNGYDQIAYINLNTLVQSAATSAQHDHERPDPAWDGRRIAYTFWDDFGTAQVGVADIVAATERALTHGSTDREAPDWSQDGRSIYCVNWTGLTSEVGCVDTSGSYTAITDDDAIRDNPDAYYRQATSATDVIYERETVGESDGKDGRRRRPGNGIWLIRHRRNHGDGAQAMTTYALKLERAVPNPATDRLHILWQTPQEQHVRLRVYNTAGRVARTLHDATAKPGAYTTVWDCTDPLGRRLPAGVYFCKLEAEGRSISQKVVIGAK